MVCQVRRPEGDVMHGAAGLQAAVAYAGEHVDQRAGAAARHAEPGALALLAGEVHPEQVGQHAGASGRAAAPTG